MLRFPLPIRYLAELRPPKIVLWCYLIWYGVTVIHHFEPSLRIWLNSLGISAVIGWALLLSINSAKRDPWQTFRMFLMPFCVSSFSSLTKGQGFILIFPPHAGEIAISAAACAAFVSSVILIKNLLPESVPATN